MGGGREGRGLEGDTGGQEGDEENDRLIPAAAAGNDVSKTRHMKLSSRF